MTGKILGKISAMRLSGFLTALIVIAVFSLSAAYAEEITYTGDGKNLQTGPPWSFFGAAPALFPGSQEAPLASGNKVTIDYDREAQGVQHPKFVAGGLSETAGAAGNTVTIGGGYVGSSVVGGFSTTGGVTGNSVTISDGFVERDISGGLSVEGIVTGNQVIINGGTIDYGVYGGASVKGSAENNVVIVKGGELESVCGGVNKSGGYAMGNTVVIYGGNFRTHAIGGWSGDGNASGNNITIGGGSFTGEICGGRSREGTATGNTVSVSGRPKLEKAYIWGGYIDDSQGDAFTGNTLNFKSSGLSVNGIGNFEYYDFYLPENLQAGAVMLGVTETVDLKGTIVAIFLQDGTKLREGDKIALIHSAEGVENAPENKSFKTQHSGTLYEFSIFTDSNNLWSEVVKISNAAK